MIVRGARGGPGNGIAGATLTQAGRASAVLQKPLDLSGRHLQASVSQHRSGAPSIRMYHLSFGLTTEGASRIRYLIQGPDEIGST
jgi:hypothetical protein